MTNANSPETGKVFYLSRHRVFFYTAGVFLLSALFAFWADNMMIGGIWEMTAMEIVAVFCVALGAAVIFFFVFSLTETKPTVAVTDVGIMMKKGKKSRSVRFEDITGVREHEGFMSRLTNTRRILVETHLGAFPLYFTNEDADTFIAILPVAKEQEEIKINIVSKKEKGVCFLSFFVQATIVLAVCAAATFPAVHALLDGFSESAYYLIALLVIYAVSLVSCYARYIYLFARYAGYRIKIESDKFSVSYGKVSKTELSLYFDSILALCIRQTLIERMFGVCRIKAESRQKAKGISEVNYFPFLMRRACAEAIIGAVYPEREFGVPKVAAGFRCVAPYLEYLVWFVAAVVIMAVFLTPFMLFLLLIPAAAIVPCSLRGCYLLGKGVALFGFGVLAENTLFVRYEDIQGVVSSENLISAKLGNVSLDITVGGYAKVFSVGFVDRAVFSELTEKMEKKVDKDNEILYN